jgi:hypothetical protein
LRNRKVVVIDMESWGREFYATVTDNRSYDLEAGLRRHIAWSSDTLAFGGKIAYEYGTKGNIDAVTLPERRAIMADPNLNLLGQPISGSQVTALALAESTDAVMPTNSSALLVEKGPHTQEKKTSFQTPFLAPDFGRFAVEPGASPSSPLSFAADGRQTGARRYSELPHTKDDPDGELLENASATDSPQSRGGSARESLTASSAVELPALRANEFRDYGVSDNADTKNTDFDGTRSLSTDLGSTSTASGLWAQVDAWSQLEQALMGTGTNAAGGDEHWESAVIQPRLAIGVASTAPETVSLVNVARLERVASFGVADFSA